MLAPVMHGHGPLSVSCFGPVSAGTVLWQHQGALRVTVVLRTAFALAAGSLVQAPAGGVETLDLHYKNDPTRRVRTIADLAPRIPRAEVLHAGSVIAPAGVTMVRLAVVRQGAWVFDKRVLASAKDDSPGLGPFASQSNERLSRLRGAAAPAPDANGVLALRDDFDFAFYQGAPPDQQLDFIAGGDQILLANLHPEIAELTVAVPSRAPAARAVLGEEEAPLPLVCKRIVLDTDRRAYALLWYAELELPGLAALPFLRIEARAPEAVAAPKVDTRQMLHRIARSMTPGPIAAVRPSAPPGPVANPAVTALLESVRPPGTKILESAPPGPAQSLPFDGGRRTTTPPPQRYDLSATPWGEAPLRPPPAPGAFDHTVPIEAPVEARSEPPPAPVAPAAWTHPPAPAAPSVVADPPRGFAWAEEPAPPAPALAPKAPAAPALPGPSAEIVKGLYGRFRPRK